MSSSYMSYTVSEDGRMYDSQGREVDQYGNLLDRGTCSVQSYRIDHTRRIERSSTYFVDVVERGSSDRQSTRRNNDDRSNDYGRLSHSPPDSQYSCADADGGSSSRNPYMPQFEYSSRDYAIDASNSRQSFQHLVQQVEPSYARSSARYHEAIDQEIIELEEERRSDQGAAGQRRLILQDYEPYRASREPTSRRLQQDDRRYQQEQPRDQGASEYASESAEQHRRHRNMRHRSGESQSRSHRRTRDDHEESKKSSRRNNRDSRK